jgi:superfamily I DNA/RNA helicase
MGPRIVTIMRKLGPEFMSQESLYSAIDDWEGEHLEKGSKTAHDVAECMRVFASTGPTLKHAIAYVDVIFEQEGTIELLTGHKAKGMEWNRVYFLDPFLIGKGEQEMNLRYVIMTRAKQELYMINTRDIP